MKAVRKLIDLCTSAMVFIAAVALIAMMLMVVLDVSLKYAFTAPVPGTLEAVSFIFMAACAFLPFASVQKQDHHITMTLATDWLPPRALRWVKAFACLGGAAYLAVFAWMSGAEAWHMTEVGESTDAIIYQIVIWPARWFVPIGTGLTACWMLLQMIDHVAGGSDE